MAMLLRWPVCAFLLWSLAWLCYLTLMRSGLSSSSSTLVASLLGVLASGVAMGRSFSRARQLALALGFPVSLWLSGSATAPAWVWLILLALAFLVYPVQAWRDAPVFPTPLNALRALPTVAPLTAKALILDGGCGLGDGLKALRLAYPQARYVGIEFSWPLRLIAGLRCPWAQVHKGDIWLDNWGRYDLVYLFQRPESIARAVAKARTELKPGAWLVSLEFQALELQETSVLQASPNRPVWLYQAPFNCVRSKPPTA